MGQEAESPPKVDVKVSGMDPGDVWLDMDRSGFPTHLAEAAQSGDPKASGQFMDAMRSYRDLLNDSPANVVWLGRGSPQKKPGYVGFAWVS